MARAVMMTGAVPISRDLANHFSLQGHFVGTFSIIFPALSHADMDASRTSGRRKV